MKVFVKAKVEKMKRILVFIIILVVVSQSLTADSVFQEQYADAKKQQIFWAGLGGLGTVLFLVGSIMMFAEEGETTSLATNLALIGGGTAASVGFGFLIGKASPEVKRLEIAVENERLFTSREIHAILNREIFIGMSNLALLASYGLPEDINTTTGSWGTHSQYVYPGYRFVYVENGKVTSWQN